ERGHELLPADAHRLRLEPPTRVARGEQNRLELGSGAHAREQRLERRLGRDVLVLYIDEPLGALDRRDRRALHLADLVRLLLERRERANDSDVRVLEVGRDAARPRIADRARGLELGAPGVLPALARALPEQRRGLAVDDSLHVVHGNVGPILRIAAA